MPSFDLIIYDFDGTLFDTRYDIANAVNLTLAGLGLPQHEPETIFNFVGHGVAHLMSQAIKGTEFNNLNQVVKRFREIYAEHLIIETDFYPHCRETVSQLTFKKQAIFSNKPERFVRDILNHFNFLHPFFKIVGGDTLPQKKPEPDGVYFLMNGQKISKESVLMVGDSDIDIETGKRAGIKTCGVTYGIGGSDAILEADFIIESFIELKAIVK